MKKSDMVRGMLFGAEFFTELHREVVKLGGSEENMFEKMKTGTGLAKKIAELIVVGTDGAKNILHVLANIALKDRIARGKYDWVNSDITEEHFPASVPANYDAEYKLFHFNCSILSDDAIKEMEKEGYRSATLAELLVLGETEPELQKQFPIIALGSIWRSSLGRHDVPALGWNVDVRGLGLYWFEGDWIAGYRFLAVRK